MFKKTLLAVGLVGLASQASAVDVALGFDESDAGVVGGVTTLDAAAAVAPVHTLTGLAGATTMNSTNAVVKLTTILAEGDKVTVTYTQPFGTGATADNTLNTILPGEGTGGVDSITLSRDGASAVAGGTSITYTVTSIEYAAAGSTANTTVNGLVYTDPGLVFAPCAAACTNKINASVSRDGVVIDAADTTAVTIGSAIAGYTVAATAKYDAVVDVNALRKKFSDGGVTDTATMTRTAGSAVNGSTAQVPLAKVSADNTVALAAAALTGAASSLVKSTVVLSGDFGFLDLNSATAGVQLTATGKTANVLGDADFAGTGTAITDSAATLVDANGTETSIDIVMTSNNTAVIPVQSMSATWTTSYTGAAGDAATDVQTKALGSFTMNGASTSFYAVPYGPGVSQLLWVANEGTSDGNLTATAFDALGNSYPATGEYSLGSIEAKSHKAIAADLLALMKADGLDDTVSNRVQIAVTATVPAANVNMYGAYRVGDSRIALETSANKDRLATKATATAVATIDTEMGVVDGIVDSILVDTGTTLDGAITTIDGNVDQAILDVDVTCDNLLLVNTAMGGAGDITAAAGVTAC